MRTPIVCLSALVSLTAVAEAQNAILYTGRFPFVSLDNVNERPGGAISQMSEFDFSWSIPVPGGSIGRTLMPATAMHSYLGDGNNDGDYLKFRGWKPSYFTNIGVDGVFVKNGVMAPTWQDVYWTPRLDATADPMEVLTNNGTPVTLAEGDWVSFLPNGNVEFFMTAAQLAVAVGAQSGASTIGAGALVQAANGDLFFAPVGGGHWVNGNSGGSVFAQDGAICKIDFTNITYDGNGNVASFAPDSARVLINETLGGPGGTLTVRQMVLNSGAQDRTGMPIVAAGVYGKTGGLGLDPNGGTWTPTYSDSTGAFPPEPNLVWCSEAGSYGGTLFTTTNQGEVVMINGALCGSTTPGTPADGNWLGVDLDIANFQPTLLGMTLIDFPTQQLIADQGDFGSLPDNVTQPMWDVDFYGAANQAVFGLITLGPAPPALVVPSLDPALTGLLFTSDSWQDLYLTTSPLILGIAINNSFGYSTISVTNPNTGGFAGFTIMVQGLGLPVAGGFQLSSPLLVQLQ